MPGLANFQHILNTCLGFTANKDCPEQGPEISPWVSLSICLWDLGRQERQQKWRAQQGVPNSLWDPGFSRISLDTLGWLLSHLHTAGYRS